MQLNKGEIVYSHMYSRYNVDYKNLDNTGLGHSGHIATLYYFPCSGFCQDSPNLRLSLGEVSSREISVSAILNRCAARIFKT